MLFLLFFAITVTLILTLPFPNSIYVLLIYFYCYFMEYFYQIKKRNQKYPIAQILGRTDFAIFPVAGYLCLGHPDKIALLYFLFFYPLALSHLGVNDLVDIKNDIAKDMKTVTFLYGIKKTVKWIFVFTLIHFVTTIIFLFNQNGVAFYGFAIPIILLSMANYLLLIKPTPETGLKILPFYHISMSLYSVFIILGSFL